MSLSGLWAQHSVPSRFQATRWPPPSWSRITLALSPPAPLPHVMCNVTTTRPQQAAAPAVVCLLRVFLLTADLLFWARWWWPAECRWRYANYTEVCHYNVAAQHRSPGSNVSQENTNHLNGIYYLYRDSETFLQILHNFHYCMKCQFLGEKIQN